MEYEDRTGEHLLPVGADFEELTQESGTTSKFGPFSWYRLNDYWYVDFDLNIGKFHILLHFGHEAP